MTHPPFGKTYLVGGSVRDTLLGLAVNDKDWVVVGASVEQMLQAGYLQVGKDFPVFLHPHTKDEYALARTERKSGRGYSGFTVYAAPDVTLEQDLARRDLTINAMAQDVASGEIIDPFHGQRDLKAKVLRHVGAAFAEDPLRVLRLARFAARYGDFKIAPETMMLARTLADELPALPAERVWQEIARGLMESSPQKMLDALIACDAWPCVFPEIPPAKLEANFSILLTNLSLPERYAALAAFATADALHERLKVPAECADLARLVVRLRDRVRAFARASIENKLNTLMDGDALRRPERLRSAVRVVEVLERRQSEFTPAVEKGIAALGRVDAGALAKTVPAPQMPLALERARIAELSREF
jgi:tRNA nucleotidyltransferase (CCA-adding enzyme)